MTDSLLQALRTELPQLRSQIYFKSALTALSHALEDVVLKGDDQPLVIANFQQERFYHQEIRRYERIAGLTNHVYVLAAPERESGFAVSSGLYESVPLAPADALSQEWHLVVLSSRFAACLICREQSDGAVMDSARRFEGFWGFDRQVSTRAAQWLLQRVVEYRPELALKVTQTLSTYGLDTAPLLSSSIVSDLTDSSIFGQRLMTYLQASQYKLLKAYQALDDKSQQERLLNVVTTAIRRSLEPEEILSTAVAELGQVFSQCRCLFYRCQATDAEVTISYEFVPSGMKPLTGRPWSLDNPLMKVALSQERATALSNVADAPVTQSLPQIQAIADQFNIRAWLLMPIQYQGTVLGMVELHCGVSDASRWRESDIVLVEALATQVGVALSQADMFTKSELLNQQLQALERTQTNLLNIVGHELRTPLSTIQVCLESLEGEPSMAEEIRQIMLETALGDTARMRKLIGDFLLLSRLESKQEKLQTGLIEFDEILAMAISGLNTNQSGPHPEIKVQIPADLPPVNIDGEGLLVVLIKLLENACKFTPADGRITVNAEVQSSQAQDDLQVKVEDTGRGIEPEQLQTIFNSFYQGEDYLRRSVGGTGLGLSICRQIIKTMAGEIWAESEGYDRGSTFYLRIPLDSFQATTTEPVAEQSSVK
ncbi:DICT sensory domain-containing protein [Acaryochloris thomasi]|nr:DICT sensory domain-containing protein [Acaryochloris thomasi]